AVAHEAAARAGAPAGGGGPQPGGGYARPAGLLPGITRPPQRGRCPGHRPAPWGPLHAPVRPGPARRGCGPGREGGNARRPAVGGRAVPGVSARHAAGGGRPADPLLRLGEPRQVGDDRVDAFGTMTDGGRQHMTRQIAWAGGLLVAILGFGALPVAGQYPKVPRDVQRAEDRRRAEYEKPEDEAWEKAQP